MRSANLFWMCLLSRAWTSTSFVSFNSYLPRQYCASSPSNALVGKRDHNSSSASRIIVQQCPIQRCKWATRTAATAAAAARLSEKNEENSPTPPTLTSGTATELPLRSGGTLSAVVVMLTSVLGDLPARQLRLIVDSPAYRKIEPQLRRCEAGDDDAGKHIGMQLRELLEAVLEVVGGGDERAYAVKVVAGCPSLLLWEARELRARVQELQASASVSYHVLIIIIQVLHASMAVMLLIRV